MNFKNPVHILIVFSLLFCISCTETKKENKNDKLLAQADVLSKEEKVPTITELISTDIGFEKLNELLQTTDFTTKFEKEGPYTMFAPLNGAINKLSPKVLEDLKKPENAAKLTKVINCHIIPGLINKQDIIKAINENGGSVKLKTLGGTRLIASMKGDRIYLIDKTGNAGRLMVNDIEATNGIIHTIESVMMPKN